MSKESIFDAESKLKSWLSDRYATSDIAKGEIVITAAGIKYEGEAFKFYCTTLDAAISLFKKEMTDFIGDAESVSVRLWPTVKETEFTFAGAWDGAKGNDVRLEVISMYQIIAYIGAVK